MSDAVVHGNTIYLAGHVADAAKGKSVGEQTRDILAQIDETLAEAGSDKTKILSATIYLADIKTFQEMNAVVGLLGLAGQHPGARHRRGEAGCARLHGRDRHGGGPLRARPRRLRA